MENCTTATSFSHNHHHHHHDDANHCNTGCAVVPAAYHNYRGAMTLNNVGIALLQQGALSQAVETLRDAIDVIKLVFRTTATTSQHHHASFKVKNNVEDCLQRATRRLGSAAAAAAAANNTTAYSDLGIKFDVVVANQDEGFSIARTKILSRDPSSSSSSEESSLVLIRLEATDFSCPDKTHDSDLDSAICLYNFGMSYLIMSKVVKKAQVARDLRARALRVFYLSHAILTSRASSPEGHDTDERDDDCEDEFRIAQIIVVAILVTHQIVRILAESGDHAEAKHFSDQIRQLRCVAKDLAPFAFRDLNAKAAPAA